MVPALIHAPAQARRGEVVEIRLLIQHAMETGYRSGSDGQRLQRDLIRRVDCRFEGETVFAAELHAAVAANPFLSFHWLATRSGTLSVHWQGDNAFAHSHSVRLDVA
jgi:sulfur-oxidizing protein SoxZ